MSDSSDRWRKRDEEPQKSDRRDFLSNSLMGVGLVVSHLTAAGMAGRYLYPVRDDRRRKLFVAVRSEIPPGGALKYEAPGGKTINVVRGTDGFIALSDICPHLGCRVHWEPHNGQFYCPCHNGRFDAAGKPVSGPPADMQASLPQYKVIDEGDLIFIEMAVQA